MDRSLRAVAGALLLGVALAAESADPAPRCAAESAQFDFWVGTWTVTEGGKPAGINRIERLLGGCALLENWQGTSGSAGKSLNFFDAGDGLWHQTWIDSSGGALFLSGRLENGAMRLEGERPAEGKEPAMSHRITWTPLPGGKVRQLWESRPAGKQASGKEWKVQFDGLYEPAK